MALAHSPRIVTDGLVLCLDAANPKSYPGTGSTWSDVSGNGNHFTVSMSHSTDNQGQFALSSGVATREQSLGTLSSTCTCVFWMKTTDEQSLFLQGDTTSYYLGAYRVGNKEYYSNCGTPDFYMDGAEATNIYDNIRDDVWHMLEFKNVNLSGWSIFRFNQYSSFTFGNGSVSSIMIYNKSLTTNESISNLNALRGRFGI